MQHAHPTPLPGRATQRQLSGPLFAVTGRLALPNLADAAARVVFLALEARFAASLGSDALAGLGLVLPLFLLVMTVSNAGMGIGVAGAVARALGAGRGDRANVLAWQALGIALVLGTVLALGLWHWAGPLYRAMGASDGAITAALDYGQVLFLGAPIICLSGLLLNVCRGAGQTAAAAAATVIGECVHLTLGLLLVPTMGLVGASVAGLAAFVTSGGVIIVFLCSRHSVVRLRRSALCIDRAGLAQIVPNGSLASINAALLQAVNLALIAVASRIGPAALAGVGLAVRFEMLLLPIVFSIGSAIVAMVGTNVGAGLGQRAKRAAWVGSAMACAAGVVFALFGSVGAMHWLRMVSDDPAVVIAARDYLQWLAPTYPAYAISLALLFAAQAAGQASAIMLAALLRALAVLLGCWLMAEHGAASLGTLGALVGASVLLMALTCVFVVWRARWGVPSSSGRPIGNAASSLP